VHPKTRASLDSMQVFNPLHTKHPVNTAPAFSAQSPKHLLDGMQVFDPLHSKHPDDTVLASA
jgi:hypothetical protein